jgi:hypothetical protein
LTNKDTSDAQIISDIDELIDIGVYDRNENDDKNDILYSYSYKSEEYEITGVEFGERFKYAVKALKSTYYIDVEHEYAPNLFK